jgi:alpha-galactosidase
MKDINRLFEGFAGSPADWITAVREQFRDIATQDQPSIIATYQTLKVCRERAAGKRELVSEVNIFIEAAVSRMMAISEDTRTGGGAARFAVRNLFYQITGHRSLL